MVDFDPGFEQELREGLRPREAPAGFTDRLMSRLAPAPRRMRFFELPALRWSLAAGLGLAAGVGGYREHQRQVAGERAREQVLLALRITSTTLHAVHEKVVSGEEDGREKSE